MGYWIEAHSASAHAPRLKTIRKAYVLTIRVLTSLDVPTTRRAVSSTRLSAAGDENGPTGYPSRRLAATTFNSGRTQQLAESMYDPLMSDPASASLDATRERL